jgi:xanthine dehydrogenase large subunit
MDKALACPGVFRILTAADIPGLNDAAFSFGPPDKVPDHIFVPVGGRVAFHSQPLALVLADSAEKARAAAKLVEVRNQIAVTQLNVTKA